MTYRTWLPKNALLDGTLEQRVVDLAMPWLQKWFVSVPDITVLTSLAVDEKVGGGTLLQWSTHNGNLSFLMSDEGWRALFFGMMGISLARKKIAAGDEAFIDDLVSACIDDFKQDILTCFTCTDGFDDWRPKRGVQSLPSTGQYVFSIMLLPKTPLMHIFVADHLATAARLAGLPPQKRSLPLDCQEVGLGAQHIGIGARVGRASLELGDFKGLAAGDVVVLDNDVECAIPLTIDGRQLNELVCHIHQDADGARLKIMQE